MSTIRERVCPDNSTVNGGRGKDYDWSLFCWDGSAIHVERCGIQGHPTTERKAPLPFKDGKPESAEYLHVPYDWADDEKIFRVRPRDKWWVGETWRGKRVTRSAVEQREDGWYWIVELAP